MGPFSAGCYSASHMDGLAVQEPQLLQCHGHISSAFSLSFGPRQICWHDLPIPESQRQESGVRGMEVTLLRPFWSLGLPSCKGVGGTLFPARGLCTSKTQEFC